MSINKIHVRRVATAVFDFSARRHVRLHESTVKSYAGNLDEYADGTLITQAESNDQSCSGFLLRYLLVARPVHADASVSLMLLGCKRLGLTG
jgi:hypothetical protein